MKVIIKQGSIVIASRMSGSKRDRFRDFVEKNLEVKDILQIDATVIVGVLIFLTVGSLFGFSTLSYTNSEDGELGKQLEKSIAATNRFTESTNTYARTVMTAMIVTSFSTSAIIALVGRRVLAAVLMIVGFIALIANLWFITALTGVIAFQDQDRAITAVKDLSKALEGRQTILNETTAGLANETDIQDTLTFGIQQTIKYCSAFPTDKGCGDVEARMKQLYEYCQLDNNRDMYCTDPTFVNYLKEKKLTS